jgi:hypothetical protein
VSIKSQLYPLIAAEIGAMINDLETNEAAFTQRRKDLGLFTPSDAETIQKYREDRKRRKAEQFSKRQPKGPKT